MKEGLFKKIQEELKSPRDLARLHKKFGVSEDTLYIILHQKVVRDTMRRHRSVKQQDRKLAKRWERGESFLEIAESLTFSPAMTASIILAKKGFPRKKVWSLFREPWRADDKRLGKEIGEALAFDIAYSPEAAVKQGERGRMVEAKVAEWLDEAGVRYLTEEESKKLKQPKTPDFLLLDKPLKLGGRTINWVECKASFGDEWEVKRDHKKQLAPYVELFGPGAVVYWFGHLPKIKYENVHLYSKSLIKKEI